MKQLAVSVNNVSKKFRLFNSPKERLFEALHPFNKKYHKEFWALRDINFEVDKGKTIGIVGRNGSGKSTLLQIICSILKPTSGEVTANGRISALLELGSSFNPEFTGRQNVLMKGMLMGFSDKEMKKRLPEIEAFADIGEFIDQPVKIYSSGMFVRLAFAVAINVDPDILVVDEALAVGDAKFQHKCFNKFLEFQKAGRTIIFVSHSNDAIIKHCDRALLLERGNMIEEGKPNYIINRYIDLLEGRSKINHNPNKTETADDLSTIAQLSDANESDLDSFILEVPSRDHCPERKNYNKNEYRQGYSKAEIVDYRVIANGLCNPNIICSGDHIDLFIKARFHSNVLSPQFGFSIKTVDGLLIYALNSFFAAAQISSARESETVVGKFSVKMNLAAGDYFIDVGVDEQVEGAKREWIGRQCAYNSLDRRCSLIYLYVREKNWFHGHVDLEAEFEEVARNGKKIKNDMQGTDL